MATKNRNRSRNHGGRDRAPRYVAPALDPNWQSPYSPSAQERQANERAAVRFVIRKRTPKTIAVGIAVLGLLVGVLFTPYTAIAALVVAALCVRPSSNGPASGTTSRLGRITDVGTVQGRRVN
jgi:hypothetical protein